MSKLKLFLLGWIFTLVWIFNFSSAWFISDLKTTISFGGAYNQKILLPETLDSYTVISIDWNCNWVRFFDWSNTNNYAVCTPSSLPCSVTPRSNNTSVWWSSENWPSCNWNVVISYSASSSKMPISALTPAIDWLHETVKQLIPLVVYLWIWILVVTLWFIAIRWLVNWMSNWIKSKFSSKRG